MVTRPFIYTDPDRPDGRPYHSKMMCRFYEPGFCRAIDCKKRHGWVYIGSHNLSAGSWGSDQRDSLLANWELGVLFVSNVSRFPYEKCGVDLSLVPIPFSPQRVRPERTCNLSVNKLRGEAVGSFRFALYSGSDTVSLLPYSNAQLPETAFIQRRVFAHSGFKDPDSTLSLLYCWVIGKKIVWIGKMLALEAWGHQTNHQMP